MSARAAAGAPRRDYDVLHDVFLERVPSNAAPHARRVFEVVWERPARFSHR